MIWMRRLPRRRGVWPGLLVSRGDRGHEAGAVKSALTDLAAAHSLTGKDRREQANFIGAERVLKDIKEGPQRRRVGLIVEGAPARGE